MGGASETETLISEGTIFCWIVMIIGVPSLKPWPACFLARWLGGKAPHMQQGRQSVTDYAVAFRSAMADSGWNSTAHCDAFLQGLLPLVEAQLFGSAVSLPICGDHNVFRFPRIFFCAVTGGGAGGQTLTCSTQTWLGGCNWTLLLKTNPSGFARWMGVC